MKGYILVNPGLEDLARQEVHELLAASCSVFPSAVECTSDKKGFLTLLQRMQSARRILVGVGKRKIIEEADFFSEFPWKDFFDSTSSFKVIVENVKGEENRRTISQTIAGKIGKIIEQQLGLFPAINLKNPDITILVFFNGEEYFVGIDLCGKEINARNYRVFPHSASFKGDFAYYCVRSVDYLPAQNLLLAFMRDGTIAIEAALFSYNFPIRSAHDKSFSLHKFPLFKNEKIAVKTVPEEETAKIHAFDEHLPNVMAAKKNAAIAGIRKVIDFQKFFLDELDIRFSKTQFGSVIIILTSREEERINEVYYQLKYVVKKKGNVLFVTRHRFDLPLSENFVLVRKTILQRGENAHALWLLQKK